MQPYMTLPYGVGSAFSSFPQQPFPQSAIYQQQPYSGQPFAYIQPQYMTQAPQYMSYPGTTFVTQAIIPQQFAMAPLGQTPQVIMQYPLGGIPPTVPVPVPAIMAAPQGQLPVPPPTAVPALTAVTQVSPEPCTMSVRYSTHDTWEESHASAVTASFKGTSADFIVRACLPYLLSAHYKAQSRQWEIISTLLALPPANMKAFEQAINAVWLNAQTESGVDARPLLNMPLFRHGAGSLRTLPNGEANAICHLRHQSLFQFRGVSHTDTNGIERRSSTLYSDVICKDHVPGVTVCSRTMCRFAHID